MKLWGLYIRKSSSQQIFKDLKSLDRKLIHFPAHLSCSKNYQNFSQKVEKYFTLSELIINSKFAAEMMQYTAAHKWIFICSLVRKKSVYAYVKVPAHCASSRGLNRSPFSISSLLATIRLCRTSMAVSPFKKTER